MKWSEIVELTQAECKQSILTMLQAADFTATSWQTGSFVLGCVEIGSYVWSKFTQIAVALKDAHLLKTAEDEALEAYGYSQYDETIVGASPAQYLLELTCEAGEGPHNLDVSDVVATDGEFTYRNVAGNAIVYPYVLAGGAAVTLLFEAEVPGSASTVAAGTITELQTTYAGVTITDGALQTSGLDKETADAYRLRCRTKWPTLSEGETISDQVVNICLNASPLIKRVTVDDSNPRGDYTFDAYVAGESGIVGAAPVVLAQAAIDLRFFSANTGLVIASAADALAITGTVYYDPNISAADAQTAVEAALTAWFKTIPINGFMYGAGLNNIVMVEDVRAAIRSATHAGVAIVRTIVLTAPAADHPVTDYDVVTQGVLTITYTAATS